MSLDQSEEEAAVVSDWSWERIGCVKSEWAKIAKESGKIRVRVMR